MEHHLYALNVFTDDLLKILNISASNIRRNEFINLDCSVSEFCINIQESTNGCRFLEFLTLKAPKSAKNQNTRKILNLIL